LHGRAQLVFCNVGLSPYTSETRKSILQIGACYRCTYRRQQKKFLRKFALSQILMKFMVVAIPRVTTGKSNSSNYESKSKPVNLALTDCILQFEYMK